MFKDDRRLNTSAKSMSTSRVEVNAVTLQENPFNSEIYLVVVFSLHFEIVLFLHLLSSCCLNHQVIPYFFSFILECYICKNHFISYCHISHSIMSAGAVWPSGRCILFWSRGLLVQSQLGLVTGKLHRLGAWFTRKVKDGKETVGLYVLFLKVYHLHFTTPNSGCSIGRLPY